MKDLHVAYTRATYRNICRGLRAGAALDILQYCTSSVIVEERT